MAKINRKAAIRAVIALFALAVVMFAYNYVTTMDFDLGSFESKGYISALKQEGRGFQAVVIKPDGSISANPGYVEEAADSSLIWRPDGQRLFFVSDRLEGEPHLFRWNPARNMVERRSIDSRSKNYLNFGGSDNNSLTLVTGGTVVQYDVKKAKSSQVLPPAIMNAGGSADEGAQDQFSQMYSSLGHSFRKAQWCGGGDWMVAIMKRDDGEVLILQGFVPDKDGNLPKVVPMIAGDHVDFDVAKNGDVAFSCVGYQFTDPQNVPPQFIKDGKLLRPFHHFMGYFKPSAEPKVDPLAMLLDDKVCFDHPKISPDGKSVLVSAGPYVPDLGQKTGALVVFSLENKGQQGLGVAQGEAKDASWYPDGSRVLFTLNGHIRSVGKDGSDPKDLTGDKGSFRAPLISPAQ